MASVSFTSLSSLSPFGHVYGKGHKSASSTDALGGIQPDDTTKTGARPGQGCTAFAIFQTEICLFCAVTDIWRIIGVCPIYC